MLFVSQVEKNTTNKTEPNSVNIGLLYAYFMNRIYEQEITERPKHEEKEVK